MVHHIPCDVGTVCPISGVVVLLDAADADGGQQGHVVRQEQSSFADGGA